MADEVMTFMVEDARIIFRNFSGKEGPYNKAGVRSFAVVLTSDVGLKMLNDGWNVHYLTSREEGEEATPFISVAVRFDIRPPRIVMITSAGRTTLTEEMVEVLDWADIRVADLIARGSHWDVNQKTGIKAYLQSLFVTIEEDALERKYSLIEGI